MCRLSWINGTNPHVVFLTDFRYEKKTDVLHNKVTTERKESKNKVEEDRYMQEEREKMAVEEYEHWLVSAAAGALGAPPESGPAPALCRRSNQS